MTNEELMKLFRRTKTPKGYKRVKVGVKRGEDCFFDIYDRKFVRYDQSKECKELIGEPIMESNYVIRLATKE